MKLQTAAWNFQEEGFGAGGALGEDKQIISGRHSRDGRHGVSGADRTCVLVDVKEGKAPKMSKESIQG